MNKPTVFISYSHKDEIWKDRMKPQLDALEMAEQIVVWDDRDIDGGDKWYPKLKEAMLKAAVAVCLISEHFLASKFCVKEEIPFLMKRAEENNMLFIPVLISPCPWKAFRWLRETQMLPRDGKSIIQDFKENWSVAFAEVSDLILKKTNDADYSLPTTSKRWLSLSKIKKDPLSQTFDKVPSLPEPSSRLPAPTIKRLVPKKIDTGRLPQTGRELFGRDKELKQLDEAWESPKTNIISFIAWGGVGKSTLINKWLEYMEADNYKDAERVFAWSFYSQGTNEQVSSADSFISEALKWFGDPDTASGSSWGKGQRLAELIRQKKTLLILDGMEPLQSSHEFERGKIKDQGLAALLRSLAMNNNGLCIITSREDVTDITKYKPKVEQLSLEELSTNAGRALLRVGGVIGTDKELETAVEAFGNHALAIKLLPVYLRSIKGHHISDALMIPSLDIPKEKGKHPRRIIAALAKRFENKPEGDLLQLLGFFDRPVDIAAIEKLIDKPVVNGLTDNLYKKNNGLLWQAINILRKESLLAKESKHRPHTLDCHPLIREHFGEELVNKNPTAWKEAHSRLYEYYKNLPKKELPDTLEEMEPLFVAVRHGCLAGKYQEAFDDVYWKRIVRKTEFYSTSKLGAFGSDLSCLSNFFESLWDKPATNLKEADKAVCFSLVGFRLRALGRLSEAVKPMKAGRMEIQRMDKQIKKEEWESTVNIASNLSNLYLTLGDIASAQKYGEQSMDLADRSKDGFYRESSRSALADTLHQTGKNDAAEILFVEAENMHKKRQPTYPYLYSLQGFQFCDLLLSNGKYKEVLERAITTIEFVRKENWLLDIALDNLTIGKASMLQSVENNASDFAKAKDYLNLAVDGMRKSGDQDMLAMCLIKRATLYRYQKDFLKSWADLDEAREIAEYGQMRLFLTDFHLEACRLISRQSAVNIQQSGEFEVIENGETLRLTKEEMQAKFQEHFTEAERLVEETGYHRRDDELDELR